jgi:type IV pilus assembly protein PilM
MFSKSITTLNVEASSVRVLSIRGRRVRRWGNVPLPPGLIRDTLVVDPVGVGAAIDELFRSAKVSKSGVLVSLTGFRSVSRVVTLPKLSATLMKEAIAWAVRREMPVPLDELYLSWQVIGAQDTEQTIFLLGTPRSLLDPFYQSLQKAGIKPRAVELKPLALARMVNRVEAIIIALETESMSTIILVKGIPEVMHTIVVKPEGLLLDDRVQKLTDDLSRTVSFYNNAHPQHVLSPATPIFLTGEMVSDPVVDLVQKTIKYPVESPVLGVEFSPEFPFPQYAANIGLALREMLPKKRDKATLVYSCPINVNVLPTNYPRREK